MSAEINAAASQQVQQEQQMAQAQNQAEQKHQMEEQRRLAMKQILSSEASERLARIRIVKPEKATQVENALLRLYQSGRLQGKVQEKTVIEMLESISAQNEPTITIRHKRRDDQDSDAENYFSD
eukprot:246739_1